MQKYKLKHTKHAQTHTRQMIKHAKKHVTNLTLGMMEIFVTVSYSGINPPNGIEYSGSKLVK